jgi:hypothetical protein
MLVKKMIALCLLIVFVGSTFSSVAQIDSVNTFPNNDYLQKSMRQKKTGNIMIGIGAGLVLTAFLIPKGEKVYDGLCILDWCEGDRYENEDLKGMVAVAGIAAGLSSILFYKASKKNARKAAAVGWHMERALQLSKGLLVQSSFPALNFRWCF